MHFFVSYKDDDVEKAHEAKKALEVQGHSAFVARYDIALSKEWRSEVRRHLEECDAMVAIVTDNFRSSAYANQEVGVILGKRKPVVSLKFAKELPGLLDDYQAVLMSETPIENAITQLVAAVQKIRDSEQQSQGKSASITERADNLLAEKISGFKDDWPGVPLKPFRRVVIKPEATVPNMLKAPLETDDWLFNNHPGILDYTDRQTTQHGLIFLSRSPRYAEISYSTAEMYYGELIRGVAGVTLGKTVVIVSAMMDYAWRTYEQFGFHGKLQVELKVGNVKGLALRDDSIIGLLGEDYVTSENEIVVTHYMNVDDVKNPVPHVATIVTEFCRAFGFRFGGQSVKDYLTRVVAQ